MKLSLSHLLIALALPTLLAASPVLAGATKVRTFSEWKFARAVLGCWGAEWRAYLLDGLEESGMETACFTKEGGVSTDSNAYGAVNGTYWFAGDKLHLKTDAAGGHWLFDAPEISCDGTVSVGGQLTLRNCVGSTYPDFYFDAMVQEWLPLPAIPVRRWRRRRWLRQCC